MKERCKRFLIYFGLFIAAGLLYALFIRATGLAIPCIFHKATGYLCPGCGLTRFCLSLLRLDFAGAWSSNQAFFILLPVIAAQFIIYITAYLRTGKTALSRGETAVVWCEIVFLLFFGIVRNLPLL